MLNKDSKILIVDDSESVRGMAAQFFVAKMGVPENNVVHAENGALGFDEMAKQRFDLVFSDIEMPFMNGFELTAKIRGHRQFCTTPVLIASAREFTDEEVRAEGVDAFCPKNGLYKNLGAAIERAVDHAASLADKRLKTASESAPEVTKVVAESPIQPAL